MESNSVKHTKWTVSDCITYETLLHRDKKIKKDLHQRDREIFKPMENSSIDKSRALKYWLSQRVKSEYLNEKVTPGDRFQSRFNLLQVILLILGILSGYGLVSGLLAYNGQHPTNISIYFWVVILNQLVIILSIPIISIIIRVLANKQSDFKGEPYNLSVVGGTIIPKLFEWADKKIKSTNTSNDFDLIFTRSRNYQSIIKLKSASLIQLYAISLNLSMVTTFILLVLFSDRAFGWQTSSSFISPELVYNLCNKLSFPWQWIWGAEVGYPSIEQIQATQIFLNQSIELIDPVNFHAWWPFLVLSTFTYGLLPRILLLGLTSLQSNKYFNRFTPNDAESNILYSRLTNPIISVTSNMPTREVIDGSKDVNHNQNLQQTKNTGEKTVIALISIDLKDSLDTTVLGTQIKQKFGWQIITHHYFGNSTSEDQEIEISLQSSSKNNLILIDQDWNPPIKQDIERIENILRISRSSTLTVFLSGIPENQGLTPADTEKVKIWSNALGRIRNPMLVVKSMEGNN
jgi:hypothetical protein